MYVVNRNLSKYLTQEILERINGFHLILLGLVWPYYIYKILKGSNANNN